MMISSYCNQLFPRALGRYIDQRSSSTRSDTNHHHHHKSIPFGMIVLLGGLASGLRTLSLQLAAHRIASRLKQYLYTALLLPPPPPTTITTITTNDHTATTASSSSLSPSYVTSILTTDVEQISQMVTSQLVNTLRSASATLFSLYHMLRISPRLVLTTITIIPTLGIGTLILNRYLKRAQPSPQAAMEYVEERLTHTRLIHQYDRARDEIQAHQQQLVREYQQYGLPAALLNGARFTLWYDHDDNARDSPFGGTIDVLYQLRLVVWIGLFGTVEESSRTTRDSHWSLATIRECLARSMWGGGDHDPPDPKYHPTRSGRTTK